MIQNNVIIHFFPHLVLKMMHPKFKCMPWSAGLLIVFYFSDSFSTFPLLLLADISEDPTNASELCIVTLMAVITLFAVVESHKHSNILSLEQPNTVCLKHTQS